LVSFLSSFAVVAGAAGAATFESSEPTFSFWYFFRMLSLWYFQNCLEASLPATRVRTGCC
jgi:hypothetical protein